MFFAISLVVERFTIPNRRKISMKRIFMGLLILAQVTLPLTLAYSIPTLQLYIPGSTYNPETESWLTTDNPFTLQVLGADQPNQVDYIKNVKLHIAIPQEYFSEDGSITVTGEGVNESIHDFANGTPPELKQPHGIYPTWYHTVPLPDLMVSTAGDIVQNYNPGEGGSDTGDIQEYTISYDKFFLIHIDLTGTAVFDDGKTKDKDKFAPYSHDADAVIPEPTTILLLSSGLVSLFVIGFMRRKKNIVTIQISSEL